MHAVMNATFAERKATFGNARLESNAKRIGQLDPEDAMVGRLGINQQRRLFAGFLYFPGELAMGAVQFAMLHARLTCGVIAITDRELRL